MKARLVSFFVFISVLFGTFCAYNIWANTQSIIDYSQVSPLSETSKIQSLVIPEGKTLIPQGSILGVNDVDEVNYVYIVDVESLKTLEVEVTKIIFEKNDQIYYDIYNLMCFDIEIYDLGDNQAEVHVSVTINIPENQEVYNFLIGSSVSFELSFFQKNII